MSVDCFFFKNARLEEAGGEPFRFFLGIPHTPKTFTFEQRPKRGGRLNPSSSPPPSKKSVELILRSGIIFEGGLLAAAIRSRREEGADNKQREKAEEERANGELTARKDRKKIFGLPKRCNKTGT